MVAEVERRFSEGVPTLDPGKDMGIKDSDFRKAIRCCRCIIWTGRMIQAAWHASNFLLGIAAISFVVMCGKALGMAVSQLN